MSSIKKLYSDHYKLLNQQVFIKEDLDYTIVDNHIKNLENISKICKSVFMIFDLFQKKHIYISKNIDTILKISFNKTLEREGFLDNKIHPDDLPLLFEAGMYFLKYGFSLSVEKHKLGKLVNEYRLLNDEGQYMWVIEQQICLENDKYGNVWLALSITDISPDQDNNSFQSRLINIENGSVYNFPPKGNQDILSMREKEILELLSKGLLSKEVADRLCISVNTVNTHRQRILKKLNANSTIEAIINATKQNIL